MVRTKEKSDQNMEYNLNKTKNSIRSLQIVCKESEGIVRVIIVIYQMKELSQDIGENDTQTGIYFYGF